MYALSPARRVRRAFLRVGILISALAFFLVGGTTLFDQWIAGHASARFMLGTAFLSAGACVGLFGLVAAVGAVVSWLFTDEAPGGQPLRQPLPDIGARLQAHPSEPQAVDSPSPGSGYAVTDRAAFDGAAGIGKAA
jgi:hypothetical protein